jgi:hypothetical protein
MDGAEHGVVLFSLGYTMHSPEAIPEQIKALFTSLGRLPQRVVMRLSSRPDRVPDNIMVSVIIL